MSANTFSHIHRVSYAETAPSDHVYYSRYLEMIEECRGEFFRSLGCTLRSIYDEHGVQFPVRECHLKYRSSARHDDELTIAVSVSKLSGARISLCYEITRNNTPILSADIEHGCVGAKGKPTRIPPEVSEKLRQISAGCDTPSVTHSVSM